MAVALGPDQAAEQDSLNPGLLGPSRCRNSTKRPTCESSPADQPKPRATRRLPARPMRAGGIAHGSEMADEFDVVHRGRARISSPRDGPTPSRQDGPEILFRRIAAIDEQLNGAGSKEPFARHGPRRYSAAP